MWTRRSCWQLAEQAGDASPHAMQRLLGEAVWDADEVRDDLRGYVADELGDPDGVLILDDTGDLKKGIHSVGVQRQYTGTAGRIENAQVAVFLAYATSKGRALIDREVYLPKVWTDDRDRCQAAGVPDEVGFATKVTLGPADAGPGPGRRGAGGVGHRGRVLRRRPRPAPRPAGPRTVGLRAGRGQEPPGRPCPSGACAPTRPPPGCHRRCWNRLSAGKGAKGERDYDWAWVRITPPADEAAGHHWLLVRRRISDGELAYYRCWSPTPVTLATLVRVAGIRWCVEECFQAGKGEVGLDQHQVRKWTSWYRYTTLVMLAHALLAVIAAHERQHRPTADDELIPLTVNEIRHLFAKLITNTVRTISYWLHWSTWRRRHQQRALTSHYRQTRAPTSIVIRLRNDPGLDRPS